MATTPKEPAAPPGEGDGPEGSGVGAANPSDTGLDVHRRPETAEDATDILWRRAARRGRGSQARSWNRQRTPWAKLGLGLLGCGGFGLLGVIALFVVLSVAFSPFKGCDLNFSGRGGTPRSGERSVHLRVAVTPRTGLADGQRVRITSKAFEGGTIVGVAMCLVESDSQRLGIDGCDQNTFERSFVGDDGAFSSDVAIPRIITVGGRAYDCAARPKRCLVVAAQSADYDVSGGQPVSFQSPVAPVALVPAGPRPESDHLPVLGTPTGLLHGSTEITVGVGGFRPGEPLLLARCTDRLDVDGPKSSCEPLNLQGALAAYGFGDLPDDLPKVGPDGTAKVSVTATVSVTPFDDGGLFSGSGTTQRQGTVDCTERPGRCAIVVAAAADPRRSAVLPYEIAAS